MSLERQSNTEDKQVFSKELNSESQSLSGVSVIIPAYNYSQYLPFAIESAISQTYSPIEIIVVDDGSTDDTKRVVAQYGDKVRYIYQKNSGLSAARNTGIQAASMPFIAFLDADDVWDPEFLKFGMNTFSLLSDDYAIVACYPKFIDQDGNPLPVNPSEKRYYGDIFAGDILLMTRFPPSAVIAKKTAFDRCGFFDTTLKSSEDRDMWLRIASKFRIYLNQDALIMIRRHSSNMSSNPKRMKVNMAKVIKKSWENHIIPHYHFWFWLKALSIHRYQVAIIYIGINKRLNAIIELIISLLLYPFPVKSRNINSSVSFIRLRSLARAIFK
ncbi:MAG TPA: glycosyltransferase family A protein [Verrucomicrobiota bacterium]|nr:glycosyltransferase family A protein [Verrucomicrobiota bacterium]